jgi:hypothetical protein
MQVFQTDEDGFFVGVTMADPDPMVPGNWLIPGGCVTVAPPSVNDRQRTQWAGNEWTIVTEPEPAPEPEPTPEEMIEAFRLAVDAHVDATARGKGYNSAAHCASYVASTHAPWAAEAQAFVAWRDQVWLYVFQQLALVEAGTIPVPASPQELISTLPAIQWSEG